ncbi:MAG: hypothetical protein AMXMBFR64_38160 [Myxococcales bacterium]
MHGAPALAVWVTSHATSALLTPLRQVLGRDTALGPPWPEVGPAIPILVPSDLAPGAREATLSLCARATPGRGVLVGGTRNKDVLLDAINQAHVFRALPDGTAPEIVAEAARQAHGHMSAVMALARESVSLRRETQELDDALADLRRARARLLHTERLSTLGRITGGLIESARQHQQALDDFRSVVEQRTNDPELMQLLTFATEGTRSIATLLDEIQAYAQERALTYTMQDESLDDLVRHAAAFVRFDTLAKQRILSVEANSGTTVRANRYRIYQVLLNLLRNALQATDQNDTVSVKTWREGDKAWIEVADTGCGMPPEVKERIFDPFFTTKFDKGLGLGLRITLSTVQHHGGTIDCRSQVGEGTAFRIGLPCVG